MQRKLFDTIGTIILAFVLAVIVWVNAIYQGDRPEEKQFPTNIPIQVLNAPPELVAVSEPVQNVTVIIKAFSSSWDKLTVKDFAASADWAGLTEGMAEVPIKVTCSDPTVTFSSIQPQTQLVTLEKLEQKTKEVTVDLQDQQDIPLGYRVRSPEVDPGHVVIDGPASAVARVDSLRVTISLINQTSSIERIVEPQPLDESGNVVQGVRLEPRTVSVTVAIEKKQNYREVVVRARTTGQPARGYFVSGVNVEPSTVTIIGPPDVIEPMGGLIDLSHDIDISGATRMVADKLALALPEGVSVLGAQEGQNFEVLVTIGVDAVTGGTTVELPLRTTRLQENLVAKVSVPIVDVILTGPAVLIDELETNLLDAYLDLSGLGEGTHQVRPQVDILVAQDSQLRELVVKDISPKSVEVVISLPPTPTPSPTWSINSTPTIRPTGTVTSTATLTATTTVLPTNTPPTGR